MSWLSPYLDETDLKHSSTRLVLIIFSFLIVIISLWMCVVVTIIAFTSANVVLINAILVGITAFCTLLAGVGGTQKVISKFAENKEQK